MRRFVQTIRALLVVMVARLHDQYGWQRTFVEQLETLGGVYIKFLQMLASHETTRHWVRDASAEMIYEQVSYEPIDVTRELGKASRWLTNIANTPFAAGSYGQVYRAQLVSGEPVILKILRPSIRRSLRQDLRIINAAAWLIGCFSKSAIIDIRAITREFSHTTVAETDYIREARNGEWLRTYYGQRHSLVIPRSYPEYGSRSVLVQQQIGGMSLAEALRLQRAGQPIDQAVYQATDSNIWQQLHLLGVENLSATLYADFQMVDPHPGNIRLLENNQVALIDFGMMAKAPTNRAAFVNMIGEMVKVYEDQFSAGRFAIAMLEFLDPELYNALRVVGRQQSKDYMEAVEQFVTHYIASEASDSLTQHYVIDHQMGRLFNQIINRGNKLGIRVSRHNIMLQRSMNMYLSTVRMISDNHSQKVYAPLLHGITREVYDTALSSGFDHRGRTEMSEAEAYEVTSNWLSQIAENDRQLYQLILKGGLA